MTEIDDAWQALNKNGFALDYDEDSRPGALAKAIDYALAAKDDEIARRDEQIALAQDIICERDRLRAQVEEGKSRVREACDLLAERTYGNAARSPGHNARLRLEGWSALSSTKSEPNK